MRSYKEMEEGRRKEREKNRGVDGVMMVLCSEKHLNQRKFSPISCFNERNVKFCNWRMTYGRWKGRYAGKAVSFVKAISPILGSLFLCRKKTETEGRLGRKKKMKISVWQISVTALPREKMWEENKNPMSIFPSLYKFTALHWITRLSSGQ